MEDKKEYVFIGTAQHKTRDYIKELEKENRKLKEKLQAILHFIEKKNKDEELTINLIQIKELILRGDE